MIADLPPVGLLVWIIVGLVATLFSAIYSGVETGSYRLSELHLRLKAERAGGVWRRLFDLTRQRERLICVLLIGNNLSNYGATAAAAVLLTAAGLSGHEAEFYTTLAVTPILFVFGEMIPKTLFQSRADTLMIRCVWLLSASRLVFTYTGLVGAVRGATHLIMRLFGHRGETVDLFMPRERIRAILLEHGASGVLSPVQVEVARNVLNLRSVQTRAAATPLHQVAQVDEHATRRDVEAVAAKNEFTRLVVHAADDRRQPIGFINVNEVLLCEDDFEPIQQFLRPAVQLNEAQPVTRSLLAMQEARCPLAIVHNARGRAIGIVTIKDLVEEIVGELTSGPRPTLEPTRPRAS